MSVNMDPRIGNVIKGLVTGNEYQVRYKGFTYEGTLERREGNNLILRSCVRLGSSYQSNLVDRVEMDRVEIPIRSSGRFNPL